MGYYDGSSDSNKYGSDYYDSSPSRYYGDYVYGDLWNNNRYGLLGSFDHGNVCDLTNIAYGTSMGAWTFLCLILFALQGWRVWSNRKLGVPMFHFKSSRGLAELAVFGTTFFIAMQMILGWSEFGLIKTACSRKFRAYDLALSSGSNIREAMAMNSTADGPIRSLAKILPALLSMTLLSFWFARLSNSLQFTVFRIGFGKFSTALLYFQWLIVALGLIVSGIAIPAIFASFSIVDNYDDFDDKAKIFLRLAIVHLAADLVFLIISMILTSITSQHIKRLNLNGKARSLWTMNIMSILPIAGIFITIAIPYALLFTVFLYFFTFYFALVSAYLPGYRFWRKAWRDANFEDGISTQAGDEEAGAPTATAPTAQPEMTERTSKTPVTAPVSEAAPRLTTPTSVISVDSDAKVDQGQAPGGESSTAARYA